ncbi:MAG TPA: DUF3276 family protein [Chitinophagaceae bacterium]|nr:DUF3276 family protein [Chitinophagaceae bacterium]
MANEHNDKKLESVYSKRIRAGKRRTYFFDVRETKGNDYYLTITESRKRFNDDGYDRHKIFLYKEDFNKFLKGMTEAIDYVKTELMPDFDFDAFNHDNADHYEDANHDETGSVAAKEEIPAPKVTEAASEDTKETPPASSTQHEDVDKW